MNSLDYVLKEQFYGHDSTKRLDYTLTGKPSSLAFETAKTTLRELAGDSKARHFMVGDYPLIDIMGAKQCGMETVLVECGIYNPLDIHDAKLNHNHYL